jgi:hypothetical protein
LTSVVYLTKVWAHDCTQVVLVLCLHGFLFNNVCPAAHSRMLPTAHKSLSNRTSLRGSVRTVNCLSHDVLTVQFTLVFCDVYSSSSYSTTALSV